MKNEKSEVFHECIMYVQSLKQQEWTYDRYDGLIKLLLKASDEAYASFNARIIPNIDRQSIIGIRLPMMRKLVSRIVSTDVNSYLEIAKEQIRTNSCYLEEKMMLSFVIGKLKDIDQAIVEILEFVPFIDNWSVNDSFCASLKITKEYPEKMYEVIQPMIYSDDAYTIRFALVMMIDYYMNEQYVLEILNFCNQIKHKDYYVKMAVAWTISICYLKCKEQTMSYLLNNQLDSFTYRKAIQKILESRVPCADEKEYLKTLRDQIE